MDRLETLDEQLDVYLTLRRDAVLPDSYRQQLRQASASERVALLRARGIYNLPYTRKTLTEASTVVTAVIEAPRLILAEEVTQGIIVRLTYDQDITLADSTVGSLSAFHVTLAFLAARSEITAISQFSATQIDLELEGVGPAASGNLVDYDPPPNQITSLSGTAAAAETQLDFPVVPF